MINLTEGQKGYIAGIIDGEGYIGMKRSFYPDVCITNTNFDLLEWFKETLKYGKIIKRLGNNKHKDAWIIQFRLEEIKCILELIKDYLIVKEEQAYLILKYISLPKRSGQEMTLDEYQNRLFIYNRLRELNKKGKR